MKTIAKRIQVDSVKPAREPLLQAARAISSGGLVVFPTRCLYGLAVDAGNATAVRKVFQAKGRSPEKPVLILIRHKDDLTGLVTAVSETATLLMEKLWPGGLTLVFQASATVPSALTAGTGKIGIRLPAHPVARALVDAVGGPITGTSANVSGQPGCSRIDSLAGEITAAAELIIDAGRLVGGVGSTVVDVTREETVILRNGAISANFIQKALASD